MTLKTTNIKGKEYVEVNERSSISGQTIQILV